MAGKRPRHIQRTTSMSQLGGGAFRFPHGLHKDAGVPVRGHSCPPKQELGHTCMETCPVSAEMAALPLATEQHVKSMVIDSSAEESLSASRMLWSGPVTVPPDDHRVPMRGPEAVSGSFGAHQWSLPAQPTVKNGEIIHFRHGRLDVGGSVRPAHFLDICYLCSKSLGHGRDVFIYRGDRAFCSFECRHLQIMADERREKSSLTGASDGLVTTVQVSDASNANHVETVGAA